jgi:hypothetical protein
MANPWLKKNPFMSMWLSGFNAAAGSMRGHAVSQAKRQNRDRDDQGHERHLRSLDGRPHAAAGKEPKAKAAIGGEHS